MSSNPTKFNSVYKDFIQDLITVFTDETKYLQNYTFNNESQNENQNQNVYLDDFVSNNYEHLDALTKSDVEYFKNSDFNIVNGTKYKDIFNSSKATIENMTMIWKYLHTLFVLAISLNPIDNDKRLQYIKNISNNRNKSKTTTEDKTETKNNPSNGDDNGEFKDLEDFLEKSSLGKFAEELVDDFSNYISEDDITFIKSKADPMDILKKIGNPLKVLDKLKNDPIQFIKKTIFKSKTDQDRITNIFDNLKTKLSNKIRTQTKSEKFVDELVYILSRYNLYSKEDVSAWNDTSNTKDFDSDSNSDSDSDIVKDIVEKVFNKLKSNDFNQSKLFGDAKVIIKNLFGEDIDLNEIIQNLKGGNLNYETLFAQANKLLKKFGLSGEDGDGVVNLAKLAKDMKNTPGMSQMLNMLGGRQGGGYHNLSANERRERMRKKLNEIKKKRQKQPISRKNSEKDLDLKSDSKSDSQSNSDATKKKKSKSKYIKKRRVRKKR